MHSVCELSFHKDVNGADKQVSVVVEQRARKAVVSSNLVVQDYGGEAAVSEEVLPDCMAEGRSVGSADSEMMEALENALMEHQEYHSDEDEEGERDERPPPEASIICDADPGADVAEAPPHEESSHLILLGGYWGAFRITVKKPLGQLRYGGYEVQVGVLQIQQYTSHLYVLFRLRESMLTK